MPTLELDMRKRIPGTISTFISENLEFSYLNGSKMILPTTTEGKVRLTIRGVEKEMDRLTLFLLAAFEIPDFVNFDDIQFVKMETPRKEVPYKPILKKPYYIDEHHKFRLVISNSTIGVSCDGELISVKTGNLLHRQIGKSGYVYANVYDPSTESYRYMGVHQLVAQAWVGRNQDGINYVVNHIDGNKTNNHYCNLEWCTNSYNSKDAQQRKRNSLSPCVSIRNIETGEIITFSQLEEARKYLNLPHSTSLKADQISKLFNDKYEIRLQNDLRPWFYTKEFSSIDSNRSLYTFVVTENDGTTRLFKGSKSLKDFYQLPKGKVSAQEVVKILNAKFPLYDVKFYDFKNTGKIEVRTPEGNIEIFNNRADAARQFRMSHDTMTKLVMMEGKRSFNGICARHMVNKPWPPIEKEMSDYQHSISIKLTDIGTGEVRHYPSITAASEYLQKTARTVRRMISDPNPNDPYKVEVIH